MTELTNIITDIRTGALPVREIPAFTAHFICEHISIVCITVAVLGTVITIIATR